MLCGHAKKAPSLPYYKRLALNCANRCNEDLVFRHNIS